PPPARRPSTGWKPLLGGCAQRRFPSATPTRGWKTPRRMPPGRPFPSAAPTDRRCPRPALCSPRGRWPMRRVLAGVATAVVAIGMLTACTPGPDPDAVAAAAAYAEDLETWSAEV